MKSKLEQRQQLESCMMAFIAQGKQVTKCKPKGFKKPYKIDVEETVEIEVSSLPESLQKKFFSEK